MDTFSADIAYISIRDFIIEHGGYWHDWYAGIASDWKERVISEHHVPWFSDQFHFVKCHSSADARDVEQKLLLLGCDGGPGGGDDGTVYAYAYRKGPRTDP